MYDVNKNDESPAPVEGPKADLELMYIGEYLRGKGFSIGELKALPETESERLMTEASQYASLKLAELESRARLRDKIHHVGDS
ncbi:MAG TPA: hypothetical protein VFY83_03545 [Anaerolineales bacterium]|nr:hypothetical protein [Anaerolineales bacterium]